MYLVVCCERSSYFFRSTWYICSRKCDVVHLSARYFLIVLADPCSCLLSRGRPRPCWRLCPGEACWFFFFLVSSCSDPKRLFVRIDTYQSERVHTRNWMAQQVVFFPCAIQVDASNPGGAWIFFFTCAICFLIFFFWHHALCGFRTENVRTRLVTRTTGSRTCFFVSSSKTLRRYFYDYNRTGQFLRWL